MWLIQHVRNGAIILAALLIAKPGLAAEECLKLKTGQFKYGDTAHCSVRIDGHIIINALCNYGVSGDMRVFAIFGVAEAWMRTELPDRPFYGYLCRTKNAQSGLTIRDSAPAVG